MSEKHYPVSRIIYALLLTLAGFFMLLIDWIYINFLITGALKPNAPLAYIPVVILLTATSVLLLALTYITFSNAYRLSQPVEKKEVIEFLGEKF